MTHLADWKRAVAAFGAAGGVVFVGTAHASPTIEDLAPPEAVFVLSFEGWDALDEGMQRAGFSDLLASPEINRFIDKAFDRETLNEAWDALAREIGYQEDRLPLLRGPVGAAMWGMEPDTATFMMSIDFMDDAALFDSLLESLADYGVGRGLIAMREEEIDDARLISYEWIGDDEQAGLDFGDTRGRGGTMAYFDGGFLSMYAVMPELRDEAGELPAPEKIAASLLRDLDGLWMMRTGSTLITGSADDAALIDAWRRADERRPGVGGEAFYLDAMAMHPRGSLGHVVINTGRWIDIFTESLEAAGPQDGMPDVTAWMRELGVADLRSISAALHMDTADGMAETTIGIHAPEREGLLSLMDVRTERFDPPPFISAQASSVSRTLFDFQGVPAMIERMMNLLEPEMRAEFEAGYRQAEPFLTPILRTLGPEVYLIETISQPHTATSEQMLVAMRVREEHIIENTLAMVAPLIGLESRRFEGRRIWSVGGAMADFVPVAVGLGDGHVFISETPVVEDALRRLEGVGERLGEQPAYRDSTRSLDATSTVMFVDLDQTIPFALWQLRNAEEVYEESIREIWADNEEWIEQMLERHRESLPDWLDDLPSADQILEHVGHIAAEMLPSDDGFRGRWFITRPE